MPAIRSDAAILSLIKRVNEIQAALRQVTVNLPLFDIANENSPTQLSANQDNYVIGNYDLLRLDSSLAVTITGLKGGIKGRFLRIFNVGSYPITLSYQDTSSDAENRFNFSNGRSAVIPPSSNITIYYDSTAQRWIGGDTQSSGSVFAVVNSSGNQSIPSSADTQVTPASVETDQYGLWDATNFYMVALFEGFYVVHFYLQWALDANAGQLRRARITHKRSDGVTYDSVYGDTIQDNDSFQMGQDITFTTFCAENDYFIFYARQETPGAGSLNAERVKIDMLRIP